MMFSTVYCLDHATSWQTTFCAEATPIMAGIRDLHEDVLFFLCIVLVSVVFMFGNILYTKTRWINILHNTKAELIWTTVPGVILILIGIPSLKLLYSSDEILNSLMTLKIKGNQWYWNYEISDLDNKEIEFDSYTKKDDELEDGELRLLAVDNKVYLPTLTGIRLLLTSEDVIHSWAVPSLGVKIDCIPGRINSGSLFILKEGTYYGQCSELCGQSHHEMSIVVEACKIDNLWDKLKEYVS